MVSGFGDAVMPVIVEKSTTTATVTGATPGEAVTPTVIVAAPFCPGSTRPPEVAEAMVGALDANVRPEVIACCEPSLNVPVTTSCRDVCDRFNVKLEGVTAIDVSVNGVGTCIATAGL